MTNFGVRQSTPGYLYDRGGSNAGASLLPRGGLLVRWERLRPTGSGVTLIGFMLVENR